MNMVAQLARTLRDRSAAPRQDGCKADGSFDGGALDRRDIITRLSRAPYHFVASGDLLSAPEHVRSMMAALAPEQRLSFTSVRINPQSVERAGRGTRYSRTNLPLPLHTDSAHTEVPHTLVAFYMLTADPEGGGRSIIVPVADIVRQLDAEIVALLRRPIFDFGKGKVPILWGPPDDPSMRYYRTQLDACCEEQRHPPSIEEAFDTLDRILERLGADNMFDLRAGELLLLNNHKVLHGRTGFAPGSPRTMHRFRLRLTDLL